MFNTYLFNQLYTQLFIKENRELFKESNRDFTKRFNYYKKILYEHQDQKNVVDHTIDKPGKISSTYFYKNKNLLRNSDVRIICKDNNPNFGIIFQLNSGNSTIDDESLFKSFDNFKFNRKNFYNINENYQKQNPIYACVYIDNNSNMHIN